MLNRFQRTIVAFFGLSVLLICVISCGGKSSGEPPGIGEVLGFQPQPNASEKIAIFPTIFPTSTPKLISSSPTSTPTPVRLIEEEINVPKLQNFLIENLGPYDSTSSTFGDLKYDIRFGIPVFNEFGMSRIDGQGNTLYNPTFEFKAPADTLVIAPISGVMTYFEWQSSENDWEIHIKSSIGSELIFGIDHVLSIDCDRLTIPVTVCDLPLKINGNVLFDGMSVDKGDVIGYVGHLSDYGNIGINGRTELTVFEYLGYTGVINHCPTLYLADEVENTLKSTISELMRSYEEWSEKDSTYDQGIMGEPGCLYKGIEEINGKIELIPFADQISSTSG